MQLLWRCESQRDWVGWEKEFQAGHSSQLRLQPTAPLQLLLSSLLRLAYLPSLPPPSPFPSSPLSFPSFPLSFLSPSFFPISLLSSFSSLSFLPSFSPLVSSPFDPPFCLGELSSPLPPQQGSYLQCCQTLTAPVGLKHLLSPWWFTYYRFTNTSLF